MLTLPRASLVITFIAVLIAVGSRTVDNAAADDSAVAVAPSTLFVQPNEQAVIEIMAGVVGVELRAWTIDVAYGTSVISFTSCEEGSVGLNLCSPDFEGQGIVRLVGVDPEGVPGIFVLGKFFFMAIGNEGDCTDITLTINQFTDLDGNETDPSVANGQVCIGDPPTPSPTGRPPPPRPNPPSHLLRCRIPVIRSPVVAQPRYSPLPRLR